MLTRMEWSDDLRIGVPAMDADHKDLFRLCNDFIDAVHAQSPAAALAVSMSAVVERLRRHFQVEEDMLDRHGYPSLAAHRAEHDRLLANAERLMARWPAAENDEAWKHLVLETAEYLHRWLKDHVSVNDRPYTPFLKSLA